MAGGIVLYKRDVTEDIYGDSAYKSQSGVIVVNENTTMDIVLEEKLVTLVVNITWDAAPASSIKLVVDGQQYYTYDRSSLIGVTTGDTSTFEHQLKPGSLVTFDNTSQSLNEGSTGDIIVNGVTDGGKVGNGEFIINGNGSISIFSTIEK